MIHSLVTAAIDHVAFQVINLVVDRVHVVVVHHGGQCLFRIHHFRKVDRFTSMIRVPPREVTVRYPDTLMSVYFQWQLGCQLAVDNLAAHKFTDVVHAGYHLVERRCAQSY